MVFGIWNYKCHEIYVIAPWFWAYEFAANVWKKIVITFCIVFFWRNVEFEHVWAAARVPPTSAGWKLKPRGSLRFEDNDIMRFLCEWLKTWSPQFKMQKHHVTGRLKQELHTLAPIPTHTTRREAGDVEAEDWNLMSFWFRVRSSTECTDFEWSSHRFRPDARYSKINGNPCKPSTLKWKLCIVVWLHLFMFRVRSSTTSTRKLPQNMDVQSKAFFEWMC